MKLNNKKKTKLILALELAVLLVLLGASMFFLKIVPRTLYGHQLNVDAVIFGCVLLFLAMITGFLLAMPSRTTKRGLNRIKTVNLISGIIILLMVIQNHWVYEQTNFYDLGLIIIPLMPVILIECWQK
ncbi:MAG: hypothetical protein KAJ64_00330 [Thermoplasmata archaeon]|nr:hypothetical protein [Thermoplasmata archaeon]